MGLKTFTGLSNGLVEGLATGRVPGGFTPRLQQGTDEDSRRNIYGNNLDDKPPWEYIDPTMIFTDSFDIPQVCERSTFDNSNSDFDWDGDGTLDRPESWEHLSACLQVSPKDSPAMTSLTPPSSSCRRWKNHHVSPMCLVSTRTAGVRVAHGSTSSGSRRLGFRPPGGGRV